MIQLPSHNICTGCGACADRCPKGCISMHENKIGVIYPKVDTTDCIDCHACEKSCPILNPLTTNYPIKCYAAWSNDVEERRTSASGGVAIEMYKYALRNGYKVVGASQNEDFSVTHKLIEKEENLAPLKNSKYVFSSAYDVFPSIKECLKVGSKILFIGLPCQVAALRKLYRDNENLLLVEVVCHGTTPASYLRQHIQYLEKHEGHVAERMSFRDPDTYTYTFTFTLYDKMGSRFYAKRTKDGDTYQYGYHRSITYRENCYSCHFAREERIADITLSDYKGLGKMIPCSYNGRKVSSVLVNTKKGADFIDSLISTGSLHADVRPVQEPIAGDKQLRQPSQKSDERIDFERNINANNGDFEKSIHSISEKGYRRMNNKVYYYMDKILNKIKRSI